MKNRTEDFKKQICSYGKEQEVQIIYGDTILTNEDINLVSFYYQGKLLKSVMKGVNIDTDVNIPIGTEFVLKYGLLVNGDYEYLTLGTFIVRDSQKQEDTNSYELECYDRLLYSMVDYVSLNITYPISVRDYINAICEYLGVQFKNKLDIFPNYDKLIQKELYLDEEGNSLDYTFRDVFDELSQVTAGVICINEEIGQIEIRTIQETEDEIDENFLNEVNVNFGEKFGPINSIVLSRANADNIYLKDEESISLNGICEIKILDNQIMNWEDRDTYLPDLLQALKGIEFYLNDFSSTGIIYYELLDRYNVRIGENVYPCVMFNNEINIEQGLEEYIYTEHPDESNTDYTKSDKTDRRILQTLVEVNKQKGEIALSVKREDIIARINMGLEKNYSTEIPDGVEKSTINFFANNLSWEADHSSMSKDGILILKNKATEPYIYTYNDIITVMKYINGELSLSTELLDLYDANGDGKVNVNDVIIMNNILNGNTISNKYADAEIIFNPLSPSEFITMKLGNAIQCKIGLNEIYNYTYRGMNMFLGIYADMNNQYGVSINGEKGEIEVTSQKASTSTIIDAGKIDAYNVYASSGGTKGHVMHGYNSNNTYRCLWASSSGTYYFAVYVDSTQIPLIKTVTTSGQLISQMRLNTSYIEFIVPRIWSVFDKWYRTI